MAEAFTGIFPIPLPVIIDKEAQEQMEQVRATARVEAEQKKTREALEGKKIQDEEDNSETHSWLKRQFSFAKEKLADNPTIKKLKERMAKISYRGIVQNRYYEKSLNYLKDIKQSVGTGFISMLMGLLALAFFDPNGTFMSSMFEMLGNLFVMLLDGFSRVVVKIPGILQKLIPVIISTFTKIIGAVAKVLPVIIDTILDLLPIIFSAIVMMVPLLLKAIGSIIGSVLGKLEEHFPWLKPVFDILRSIGSLIMSFVNTLFNPEMLEILKVIGIVIAGIFVAIKAFALIGAMIAAWPFLLGAAIIAGIALIIANWEKIKTALSDFFLKTIPEFFSRIGNSIGAFFTKTLPNLIISGLMAIGKFLFITMPQLGNKVIEMFMNFFTKTLPSIFNIAINAIWSFFAVIFPGLLNSFAKGFKIFFTKTVPKIFTIFVKSLKNFFIKTIPNFFKKAGTTIWKILSSIPDSLWRGVSNFIKHAKNKLKTMGTDIVQFFNLDNLGKTISQKISDAFENIPGLKTIRKFFDDIMTKLAESRVGKWLFGDEETKPPLTALKTVLNKRDIELSQRHIPVIKQAIEIRKAGNRLVGGTFEKMSEKQLEALKKIADALKDSEEIQKVLKSGTDEQIIKVLANTKVDTAKLEGPLREMVQILKQQTRIQPITTNPTLAGT